MRPLVVLGLSVFLCLSSVVAQEGGGQVATDFVKRVCPEMVGRVVFQTVDLVPDKDAFELSSSDGKLVIKANNVNSMCAGFNWFLKYYAHCQVSWNGTHVDLPSNLTLPAVSVQKEAQFKWRHYYNYCTGSYTMAFKDWNEWEKELDLLALRGINLALILPGHEKVWQNTLKRLGYSNEDISAFIPTSAHTAWWLMGNMENPDAPVSQSIIDGEAELGRKILDRMRELNIEPIVNGFYGMVPTTFTDYFPEAEVVPQGNWMGNPRPSVLSPVDPLFSKISTIWYEEMEAVFGEVNFFSGDLFHEGGDTGDLPLGDCGAAVQNGMLQHNPGSRWVLMSWQVNPRAAILDACDKERLLILQLAYSANDWEQRGYWGTLRTFDGAPWTLSFVLNFGASEGMYGNLRAMANVPEFLSRREDMNDCVGIGILCEGTRVNPITYDLSADLTWMGSRLDIDWWLESYVHRRYGVRNDKALEAWRILEKSVYRVDLIQEGQTDSIICAYPTETVYKARPYGGGNIYYDEEDVLKAAELLLECSSELKHLETYRYDLVDVTRQILQDYARTLHPQIIEAYLCGDKSNFERLSSRFLQMISDTDRLLASNQFFLLGTWLEDARKKAGTQEDKNLMERSARSQITRWSSNSTGLTDYANRQWAGLMKDYYKPRWQIFFNSLKQSLEDPSQTTMLQEIRVQDQSDLEFSWIRTVDTNYSTEEVGDSIKIAKEILKMYAQEIRLSYAERNKEKILGAKWKWDLSKSTGEAPTFKWDIYDQIQNLGPGTYKITFIYESGAHALQIDQVELVQDGVVLAVDKHLGWAGLKTLNNTYSLILEAMPATVAPYSIQATVHGAGGNDSQGRIVFRKVVE